MKLWEPPYYDPEKKSPVEGNLNELAVTLMVIFGTNTILMFLLVMTVCGYLSLKKNVYSGRSWAPAAAHLPGTDHVAAECPGEACCKGQVIIF